MQLELYFNTIKLQEPIGGINFFVSISLIEAICSLKID